MYRKCEMKISERRTTEQVTNLDLRLMMALIETALPQVETSVRTMHTRARRISTDGTACWFHIMVTGEGGGTWSRDKLPMSREKFPDELFRRLPDISSVFLSMSEGTRVGVRSKYNRDIKSNHDIKFNLNYLG